MIIMDPRLVKAVAESRPRLFRPRVCPEFECNSPFAYVMNMDVQVCMQNGHVWTGFDLARGDGPTVTIGGPIRRRRRA